MLSGRPSVYSSFESLAAGGAWIQSPPPTDQPTTPSVFGLCEVVRRLEPKFRQPASQPSSRKERKGQVDEPYGKYACRRTKWAPSNLRLLLAWPLSKSVNLLCACTHSPLPPFRNQNRPTTTQPVDKKSRCWISGSLPRTRPCASECFDFSGLFQFFSARGFLKFTAGNFVCMYIGERFVMEINAHYEFQNTVVSLKDSGRNRVTWRLMIYLLMRGLSINRLTAIFNSVAFISCWSVLHFLPNLCGSSKKVECFSVFKF